MNKRKDMIFFALRRMNGFKLDGSSDGDNRSIFGLIKMIIESVPGDKLVDCRKPLAAILNIKTSDQRKRFQGCKITLLHQTIITLFGDLKNLFFEKEFINYNRFDLLEYLELCRRIFISKYINEESSYENSKNITTEETQIESAMGNALRLALERSIKER